VAIGRTRFEDRPDRLADDEQAGSNPGRPCSRHYFRLADDRGSGSAFALLLVCFTSRRTGR